MGDLLKEAIADAKAVRETALQNAKMALEEAFTPQLKSMLVAKLKEDELDETGWNEDDEMGDEEEVPEEEPEDSAEEMMSKDEMSYEDEMGDEEGGEDMGDEEDMEEEGLDLEAIIRELEAELSEEEGLGETKKTDDEDEPVEEASEESKEKSVNEDDEVEIDETVLDEDEDEDEDKEEVDEVDQSSAIGKGTGRGNTDRSSGIGTGKSVEKVKMESVTAELAEYKEAVTYLKDKLHEVNILNAKLLFTNKLFKEFVLDNNQKLKVVETFDRAQTTREIKLVYSTLAEQFGDNNIITKRKSIKESASSAIGSTKPSKESKKVISEEAQVANRFRVLAGILKD